MRGIVGGGFFVVLLSFVFVSRFSISFCRLLSFGGSFGGLSFVFFGGLVLGIRVSFLFNMAFRFGSWLLNLGLLLFFGLSFFGNCGNGYRLYNNNFYFDMIYLVF